MKQWDEIFKKYGKIFIEPQEDMGRVAEAFKNSRAKKILDLGCGTGRHLVYLAKKGFSLYGFDIMNKLPRNYVHSRNKVSTARRTSGPVAFKRVLPRERTNWSTST
jgi:SAM-dependent methyltransferase